MQWFLLIAGIGLAVVITVVVVRKRRNRRPLSPQEKAEAAMRALRRKSPRSNRDALERGRGVPDRHSGAIAENSIYGDASSFDSGGGSSSSY